MAAPTRELLKAFDILHQTTLGVRAVINGARDGKILARLWSSHGEMVDALMQDYFNSRDAFIERQGYSVPYFAAQFPRLLATRVRADQRAEHAARPSGDWVTECIRLHQATCSHRFTHAARMAREGVESRP